MKVQIRKATDTDIPSILRLYAQLEQGGENTLPLLEAAEIFRRIESYPNYHVYIAEQQGEILGTFSMAIMDNLAHLGARSGLIEDVVVDEKHRSQGIGKEMMRYAIDLCRENACYKASLSSNINREDAHRFYESLGFQIHGFSFQMQLVR
ncbi:Aminoalkylphosphonate N-acetyltransferase [bioreactor metagenome]|uniref:Aminoalkylphosphonate N-acetyltransferase n=1 Tax=bioreactor metagenome TaxID=1076179 RepID=A0A644XP92_9ZZZZ